MKAVILAGGFGKRLRPITYQDPKPMVPVQGKPFIEYMLNLLKSQGINEIILCLHYMPEKFIQYFGEGSRFGLEITYNVETTPLGTGGAIKSVENYIDGTFLVLNGDTYVNLSFQNMLGFHKGNEALGTIALIRMKNSSRYGIVNICEDFRITSFLEKASVPEAYVNAGAYLFEERILNFIPGNREISLEREVLPGLLDTERVFGFPNQGYFIDIGVPDDYSRFQSDVAAGVL